MPSSQARAWKMLLPLAAVLLLCALWTTYWFIASAIARERLSAERAALAARGVTLECMDEAWGGFPFRFEFICTSPLFRPGANASLKSERLHLVALAYAPRQVAALIDGPSIVSAPGIDATVAQHQRVLASLTYREEGGPLISAEIPALQVDGLGRIARLLLHARPSAGGGVDLALSAAGIDYRPAGKIPLALDTAEMTGSLRSGNLLEIERAAIEHGSVRYWGKGALALDQQRRPSGRIDTETNDINGLLGILEPHLKLSADQIAGLRVMLGLLGNEAKAPLIAQDGKLFLGPFAVADLAPVY